MFSIFYFYNFQLFPILNFEVFVFLFCTSLVFGSHWCYFSFSLKKTILFFVIQFDANFERMLIVNLELKDLNDKFKCCQV